MVFSVVSFSQKPSTITDVHYVLSPHPLYNFRAMITFRDWQLNNEKWLDQDLKLMTTDEGWKERDKKNDITIWQRPFADDKNDLFRWRIPKVAANHNVVFDVFVNKMIDYHQYWTAEYTGGFVVEKIDENTQIIYQQFNPNIPFISKRDLLYIQWSRKIDDKTTQTSFKSIVWESMPVPTGFERINWWGAHLLKQTPTAQVNWSSLTEKTKAEISFIHHE